MIAPVDLGKRGIREMVLTTQPTPSGALASNLTALGWEPTEWIGHSVPTGKQRPMCALVRRELATGKFRAIVALPQKSTDP